LGKSHRLLVWQPLDAVKGQGTLAEGGEAQVYYEGKKTVTKLISLDYYITPQFALDRTTLHNTFFNEAPLTVKGFAHDTERGFVIIVEQPFIKGSQVENEADIDNMMKNFGFSKVQKPRYSYYTDGIFYISDLHDENVLQTPEGNLAVIDADLRLNTPDLNARGIYQIANDLAAHHKT